MFESSHFETLKFIIPNFLCFHPIVFPVKREGHFSPLPPFSVSCILFVAPRRSLNETRHFRTLSSWHKYFGPILRRSLRFPRLEKHVHAKESTLGFSFFPLSLLFFFFFLRSSAARQFSSGNVYLVGGARFRLKSWNASGRNFYRRLFPARGKLLSLLVQSPRRCCYLLNS